MLKHVPTDKRHQGFSLVEVLVATAVIAIAIPALMLLMMQQADNAGTLRDKTIATWIAENTLNRLRIERQLSGVALTRTLHEEVTMAGMQWLVATEPQATAFGALLKYRTSVSLEQDKLVTLDTFIN